MAEKKVYIGSVGPFLFEDVDSYDDGKTLRGLRTNQIYLEDAATGDNEIVRKFELDINTSTSDSNVDSKNISQNLIIVSMIGSKNMSQSVVVSSLESKVDSLHP